jgi:hypothetical protein
MARGFDEHGPLATDASWLHAVRSFNGPIIFQG